MRETNTLLSRTTLLSCFPAVLYNGHASQMLPLSHRAPPLPCTHKPFSHWQPQEWPAGIWQGERMGRAARGLPGPHFRSACASWEGLEEEQVLAPLARSRLRATGVCGHWMPLNISQCPQDKVNWWLRQNSALRAVMLRCPNSWSTNFCLFVLCTHFPSHFKAILCWQKVPCWQLWMTQELNASPRTGRAAGCIASLLAPTPSWRWHRVLPSLGQPRGARPCGCLSWSLSVSNNARQSQWESSCQRGQLHCEVQKGGEISIIKQYLSSHKDQVPQVLMHFMPQRTLQHH